MPTQRCPSLSSCAQWHYLVTYLLEGCGMARLARLWHCDSAPTACAHSSTQPAGRNAKARSGNRRHEASSRNGCAGSCGGSGGCAVRGRQVRLRPAFRSEPLIGFAVLSPQCKCARVCAYFRVWCMLHRILPCIVYALHRILPSARLQPRAVFLCRESHCAERLLQCSATRPCRALPCLAVPSVHEGTPKPRPNLKLRAQRTQRSAVQQA